VINEASGFAYIVGGSNGCSGGLHMVDITNPLIPPAGWLLEMMAMCTTHCVMLHATLTLTGSEFLCSNEDTITVTWMSQSRQVR
jgi:hypothetical protein